MVFLNPLFLWTLLGVSIPIAIHFWSKKKVKTIKIGSTQLLKELNPKQTSSIHLNQLFLLLLRMIIIGLIAFILAVPRFELQKSERSIAYLVEPSLLEVDIVRSIIDTLTGDQVRLLLPEFPLLEEMDEITQNEFTPNYWQLSQAMKNLEVDSVIVLSEGFVQGFKGMRPKVDLPIHWLMFDSGKSALTPVEVTKNKDQFVVTSLNSDQSILQYKTDEYTLDNKLLEIDKQGDSIYLKKENNTFKLPLLHQKPIRILIASDEEFSVDQVYIASAFKALSKYLNQDIQLSNSINLEGIDPSLFDVLVWLKQEAIISFKGQKLQWQEDDLATNLIEASFSKDQYFLRHHLDSENIVDMNLPAQLVPLLDLEHQLPKHFNSLDLRTLDLDEIQVNRKSSQTLEKPKKLKDISTWLWTLLLFVIPLERILSKYKKQ